MFCSALLLHQGIANSRLLCASTLHFPLRPREAETLSKHSIQNGNFKHGKALTYFMATTPEGDKRGARPLCALEQAIEVLSKIDFPDPKERAKMVGGEFWVQNRGNVEDVGFHYDKDEAMASDQGRLKCPAESTVTYLGNSGAPTLIVNRTTPDGNAYDPPIPSAGVLSYPKRNRHIVFRGNLAHGCPGSLSLKTTTSTKRLTFLVNWWEYKPDAPNCVSFTQDMADELGFSPLPRADPFKPGPKLAPISNNGQGSVVSYPDDSASLDLHRVSLQAPDEQFYFKLPPKMQQETLHSITWSHAQSFGRVAHLDLDDDRAMNELWESEIPLIMAFVKGDGKDTAKDREFLDAVLAAANTYSERARLVIGHSRKCMDAMESFGLQTKDLPAVAIHVVANDADAKFLPPKPLRPFTADAVAGFVEAYFADDLVQFDDSEL